jgi:prepilin-type N-terminal cleavage/methylation domain-containing protein
MILKVCQRIGNNQKGFTLVELLVAMAVASIIAAAIGTTTAQVFNLNTRTSNHMVAVRQVQSAGYWVSRDAQMAQSISAPSPSGFPLTLSWVDWDGTPHSVVYSIVENHFRRTYGATESVIASHIDNSDPSLTRCDFVDTDGDGINDKVVFTVTATVGSGSRAQSETRTYEVNPRSGP